jgi:glycosyltransferase involved in cell wall biosynthesis
VRALHQILGALHAGDAVGHEALAIQAALRRAGRTSEIFAGRIDASLRERARPLPERPDAGAAWIYHFAPGSPATEVAQRAPGDVGLVYHNVTPPELFGRWDREAARLSAQAAQELSELAPRAALAVAHSEFSRKDLLRAGFASAEVVPYPVPLRARAAASGVLGRLWADGRPTFLAVGRVVPSKRLEDVIAAYAAYRARHARRARLLLLGETESCPRYAEALAGLAAALGAEDVELTGRVSDADLAAAYAAADVLLCLSAHEGYGVPLVEAMRAGLPVLARDAGAVGETLRGGGVLLRDASPAAVADLMAALQRGGPLRPAVLEGQARALAAIEAQDYEARLLQALAPLLGGAT